MTRSLPEDEVSRWANLFIRRFADLRAAVESGDVGRISGCLTAGDFDARMFRSRLRSPNGWVESNA